MNSPQTLTHDWIQNIWGVGRNFKLHAQEMNAEVPSSPLIFLKSGASLQKNEGKIVLPSWTQDVHHEVELAVQVNQKGEPQKFTLALDLTERHFQSLAKAKGQPWTLAKSFQGATVLGAWKKWHPEVLNADLELSVNGVIRQRAPLSEMIFSIEQVVDDLRKHFPLCDNDVILMGTPSGVSSLVDGDLVAGRLGSLVSATWTVRRSTESIS